MFTGQSTGLEARAFVSLDVKWGSWASLFLSQLLTLWCYNLNKKKRQSQDTGLENQSQINKMSVIVPSHNSVPAWGF